MIHRERQPSPRAEIGRQLADERVHAGLATDEAARRFGGIDLPASLAGALSALGLTVLVGGILASIGSLGYRVDGQTDTTAISALGFAAGVATLLIAFGVGGWVAGRMARFDGGRNGLMTAIWYLILIVVASGIGALIGQKYDALSTVQAPHWFADNTWTSTGIISGAAAIAVMLVAAFVGGRVGQSYNHRADDLIAATGARHDFNDGIDLSKGGRDPALGVPHPVARQ